MSTCHFLLGQDTVRNHKIDREFSIRYDNDVYFFSDKYYTSGVDLSFSKVINSSPFITSLFAVDDGLKGLLRFNYGHKIFTPEKIMETDLEKRDRPYAGWHYFRIGLHLFPVETKVHQFSTELGVVGNRSGIGNFQKWYHRTASIVAPEGWSYQITNEFIVNLRYNRLQSFKVGKIMDFILESDFQIGNGQSYSGLMGTVRFGRINALNNSAYAGSRMSSFLPSASLTDYKADEEGFLFYGFKGQYVLNNVFIEGSLFNNDSPHQEEIENFITTHQMGYMYSNYYTTVSVTIYMMSKEVLGGKKHSFASMALMLRF